MSEDYPIVRVRKAKSPTRGRVIHMTYVYEPRLAENMPGVNPLKDGWDPGEDPVRDSRPRRLR